MAEQQPLDLVILFMIVDYLRARPATGGETDHAKQQEITTIVNNICSRVTLDSIFRNETRESMRDNYTVGQAGAVGPNSMASGQTFHQIWVQSGDDIDLPALADQLARLRDEMRAASGGTPEEDVTLAELAQAEVAAKKGDGSSVISHLAQAGNSALDIAKQIGIEVAAKAIAVSMGLPG